MEKYLEILKNYKSDSVFNPWGQSDKEHDIGNEAPKIRFNNLTQYLKQRENAKYLLIAEALGYQGGHFSGIAMTSERQLLSDNETMFEKIFKGPKQRTSCSLKLSNKGLNNLSQNGFAEPTGTIVWNTLSSLMGDTYNWINWNTYPFHPYKSEGILTNRTPSKKEVEEAEYFLSEFLKAFGEGKEIIAIGNYSELVLTKLNKKFIKVRHPANGGAGKFKNQVSDFLKNK